ncbi:MAG TPA: hypothetical protein VJM76_00730 [Gammaproteobacteria bacterium]|nr:hypothetical protein [Gammaproteobacteria bacterium]
MDFNPTHEIKTIGLVLDQSNRLEQIMKEIITSYIRPRERTKDFVEINVLNNSVVSFASKIKLILAINNREGLVKLDQNKLHRLLSIRNAFAHNDVISGIRVHVPHDPGQSTKVYMVLDRMKGDGGVETLSRDDAYADFYKINLDIEPVIQEMAKKVRALM